MHGLVECSLRLAENEHTVAHDTDASPDLCPPFLVPLKIDTERLHEDEQVIESIFRDGLAEIDHNSASFHVCTDTDVSHLVDHCTSPSHSLVFFLAMKSMSLKCRSVRPLANRTHDCASMTFRPLPGTCE